MTNSHFTKEEIETIKNALLKPLDVLDHEWLNYGNTKFVYLRTPVIEATLDKYTPGWGTTEPIYEITGADKDGDRPILMKYGIVMPWGVTYWGVGGANKSLGAKNSPEREINNLKAAKKDAEKVAARALGIGRWLDSGELNSYKEDTGQSVFDSESLLLYLRWYFPGNPMFDHDCIGEKRSNTFKKIHEAGHFKNKDDIYNVLNNYYSLSTQTVSYLLSYWSGIDRIARLLKGYVETRQLVQGG